MWERNENRLAVLELLEQGLLRRRVAQADAWCLLDEMSWTRRTGRREEIALHVDQAHHLIALLDRVWPPWKSAREALAERGLHPTPSGWRQLQDLIRADDVSDFPDRLNRRTALSAIAPHSKSALTSSRKSALGATTLTHDGIVRLRAPAGLRVVRGSVSYEAAELGRVLNEVIIPERALLDGTVLEGPVSAALTVENIGAFQDVSVPEGWLVIHVPGWDTSTIRLVVKQLQHVPVAHFGDLDPMGVRIFRHLQDFHPPLRWIVPDFWSEQIDKRALHCPWPERLDLANAPALVRKVAKENLWLEQEAITVDPRLREALEMSVSPK